jgi:hypothetical protein
LLKQYGKNTVQKTTARHARPADPSVVQPS